MSESVIEINFDDSYGWSGRTAEYSIYGTKYTGVWEYIDEETDSPTSAALKANIDFAVFGKRYETAPVALVDEKGEFMDWVLRG